MILNIANFEVSRPGSRPQAKLLKMLKCTSCLGTPILWSVHSNSFIPTPARQSPIDVFKRWSQSPIAKPLQQSLDTKQNLIFFQHTPQISLKHEKVDESQHPRLSYSTAPEENN